MIKLSCCMIVRDAALTIVPCLTSIRPWVGELIVVDTGSRDNTAQLAQELGAKVFHFPWVDSFAAARNESLRLATGEWLFWMDADDVMDDDNGRRLRDLAYGPHGPRIAGYVIQVHCPDSRSGGDITVVDHVKLFRNHPSIRFEHRIHEQVLMPIRRLGGEIAWTDIFVVHANSDQTPEGRQRKYERDLRLLELDLLDYPEHSFVLFNFGMTYNDMGEHTKAVDCLQRSISVADGMESHLRKAYALLVHSLSEVGQTQDAIEVCERALEYFPKDPELRFRQGMLLHHTYHFTAAAQAYKTVLCNGDERHLTSCCQAITGYKARHNLALVYRDIGNHAAAELQWRAILDEKPQYRPAWKSVGEAMLRQRKITAVQVHAEHMLSEPTLRGDGLMLQADSAFICGEKLQALALSEQSVKEFPNDNELFQSRCRLAFELESWDEAANSLDELSHRLPKDGAVWHNLGLARYRRGDCGASVDALEQSLAVRPDSDVTKQLLLEVRSTMELHRELPVCHCRRPLEWQSAQASFFCAHPKIHTSRNIVTAEICRQCTRWKEPPPAQFRPDPPKDWLLREGGLCKFLGKQVGLRDCPSCRGNVQLKVFACSHPDHETTTISDCEQCIDYQPQ